MPTATLSPAATSQRRKLTPPQYAQQLGVDVAKVLKWIRSGELRAFNAATNPRGKPRYLIDVADAAAFEAQRSVNPSPPVRQARRKRRLPDGFVKYF
jgi:hypothetical protein